MFSWLRPSSAPAEDAGRFLPTAPAPASRALPPMMTGAAVTATKSAARPPAAVSADLPTVHIVVCDSGIEGTSLNLIQHGHLKIVTGEGRCGPMATFSLLPDRSNGLYTHRLQSWSGSYVRMFPKPDTKGNAHGSHGHMQGYPFGVDGEGESEDDLNTLLTLIPANTLFPPHTVPADAFVISSALHPDTFMGFQESMKHRIAAATDRSGASLFRLQASGYTLKSALEAAALLAHNTVNKSVGSFTHAAVTHTGGLSHVPKPAYALSPEQKAAFMRDGFVILPGAVSKLHIQAAVREINFLIGRAVGSFMEPGTTITANELQHSSHPVLVALGSHSQAWSAAESLIGVGKVHDVHGCQVAPRFPKTLPESLVAPVLITPDITPAAGSTSKAAGALTLGALPEHRDQGAHGRWHVDGMDKHVACPFDLLCGVMLNDTLEDGCGQLTVYPGSHIELFNFLQARGEEELYGPGKARPALKAQPYELKMRAGDAVLAHPLLAHRVGVNYSDSIRYAVFFRLNHKEHAEKRLEVLRGNLWACFDGLKR